MSYRSQTTVDLRNIRTACLSGENGAGKSALLEAMTWAVWGKSRASSGRDVVTIGESQVEVTFDFLLGDREYRVFRRQSVGARTSTALEFFVRAPESKDEDDWQTITADNTRATERKIVETLKLDYDTFVNSAFLMQGQADAFTDKPPGDRKKILANILNLGEYDVLSTSARDEERTLRSRANQLTGQIDRLQQQLAERPEVEAQLERLSAKLIEASSSVELLETDVRTIQEALSAMATLVRARDAASSRVQRITERLTELRDSDAADRKSVAGLGTLLDRAEQIEHDYKLLITWRERQQSLANILRERQPLEASLTLVEREIDAERSRLEREVDNLDTRLKQCDTILARLAERQRELEQTQHHLAESANITARVESTQREIRALETEKTTLEAECKALKTAMNDIKANMDLLTSGDAECPICRRPISDGEHVHVKALWTAEGKALGDRYREHGNRIKQIDRAIENLASSFTVLQKQQATVTEQQVLARRLEAELQEKASVAAEEAGLRKRLAAATAALAPEMLAREQVGKAESLRKQLARLPYDADEAAEANKHVRKLQPAEGEYMELQTARVRHANLTEALARREAEQKELDADLQALRQEIDEINQQLGDERELRERFNQRSDELDRARSERDHVQSRFGSVSGRIAELDRIGDELKEIQSARDAYNFDADAYRELSVAFGRNGIQAMIVETVLPELEDEANRLLARMTTSHLHVRIRSTRQAISNDNIIETLDIVIRDETGERPYALYSGGEAFRIDFAIRVALSKLLARRAGTTIDMLIIDEGFGTQDARGRDGLIEALRSVEQDFATILVITHIDEIREMFPTRIEVTKSESGSHVTVT